MPNTPFLSLNFRHAKWVLLLAVAMFATSAMAGLGDVMTQFQTTGTLINERLLRPAVQTAVAALMLQMLITYSNELFGNRDMSSVLGRTVIMMSWFGFALLLIRNMDVLSHAFVGYVRLSGDLAGLSASEFTPGGMIDQAKLSIKTVHKAVHDAMGDGFWAIAQNLGASITLVFVDVVILFCYFIIALTLFVVTLEFWMLFAIAPLALGMIPLQAFRDQGMAPLKGVIALGIRVVILGAVVAVAKSFSATAATEIPAALQSAGEDYPLLSALGDYLAGVMGCAMMAVYSGKLAATIANGSANFNGADAVKTGMQIVAVGGAAAGLAAAAKTAGGAVVGGVARSAMDGISKFAGTAAGEKMAAAAGFSPGGGPQSASASSELGKPIPQRPELFPHDSGNNSAGNTNAGAAGIGGVERGSAGGGKGSLADRFSGGATPGDSDAPPTTVTINTRGGNDNF